MPGNRATGKRSVGAWNTFLYAVFMFPIHGLSVSHSAGRHFVSRGQALLCTRVMRVVSRQGVPCQGVSRWCALRCRALSVTHTESMGHAVTSWYAITCGTTSLSHVVHCKANSLEYAQLLHEIPVCLSHD